MLRRVLVLVAVVAAFAVATSPSAFAASPPCSPSQPQQLASAHFVVTFNDDPQTAAAGPVITTTQAGTALATAEQQYNALTALGFPAPVPKIFAGKTYIHVVDLAAFKISSYNCPGEINVDGPSLADNFTLGFDVFEEIEYNYGNIDGWLIQGLASWGGWKSIGYPENSTAALGPWDMSLDCALSPSLTSQLCSTNGYTNSGLSRWPFYEYLAERFGTGFVSTLLTAVNAAGGDGLAGLNTALAAQGTTLAAEYGAFTTKLLAGGWTAQQLNLTTPPITGSPILTGTQTGDIGAQTFGVDHLATRFVQIDRGAASGPTHCYAANLALKVTIPAGVTSQPVFYWAQAGSTPVALTLSGQNATATVPWDTCTWKTIHGYLSLPNTSMSTNAALFTVSAHLDVLPTEVTATGPSTPANGYGSATDVSSTDGAPVISVFGPLLLSLPATAKEIQLIVQSNAEGTLHATLGSLDLGQQKLVPGATVVRYALPAGVLQKLRTFAAVSNVLTLSPLSNDGKATGAPVSLKVTVEPVKKTAKPMPKPKKHKTKK
jgi:hypothetical protein